MMIFLMFLDLVCKYFVANFCMYVHKGNWSVIFFLCWVCISFRYQSKLCPHKKNRAVFVSILWNDLRGIGINHLKRLVEFCIKTIWPRFCMCLFACFDWEGFNDCFCFTKGSRSVYIVYLTFI